MTPKHSVQLTEQPSCLSHPSPQQTDPPTEARSPSWSCLLAACTSVCPLLTSAQMCSSRATRQGGPSCSTFLLWRQRIHTCLQPGAQSGFKPSPSCNALLTIWLSLNSGLQSWGTKSAASSSSSFYRLLGHHLPWEISDFTI